MLGRSSRLHLTLATLRRTKADLVVIALYDLMGAAIAILGLVAFGVTKPVFLVEYFSTDPWVAWAFFGAVGPILAVGLVDRVPIEKFIDLSQARPAKKEVEPTAVVATSLRSDAVKHILHCHWEDIRVMEGGERYVLLHRAKDLLSRDLLHFDDVAEQITAYATEFAQGELPEEIAEILERRATWPTDHDPFNAALGLVSLSLREGLVRPVSIACRIRENGVAGSGQPVETA